jgi:nitric oxide reductase NorQ protein
MEIGIPARKHYFISENHSRILEYVDKETDKGHNVNVMVKGLSGCGKSELPTQYAATRNRPLAVIEVGRLSEATQIFGSRVLDDGKIVYKPGLFTQALKTPNCVVHLQELNRPENDKALNAIFSVLDETFRAVYLDEADELVEVASGVTFFATLNQGYQFIGTMPIDEALENRFALKMELGYLPTETEISILALQGIGGGQATQIVTLANGLRHNAQNPIHISVRQIIEMAKLVDFGFPLIEAFQNTVAPDNETLESILLQLHLTEDSETIGVGNTQTRYTLL